MPNLKKDEKKSKKIRISGFYLDPNFYQKLLILAQKRAMQRKKFLSIQQLIIEILKEKLNLDN